MKGMVMVVCGGSGSGKSEFAEQATTSFARTDRDSKLLYIATMMGEDAESKCKIQRHRHMRKDKGFETIECFFDLKDLVLENNSIVLLDCLSNLVSNECFAKGGAGKQTVEEVLAGIYSIKAQAKHLIIVTNDVFGDAISYDPYTQWFMQVLGQLNCHIAALADEVVEVVYGIPVYYKGFLHGLKIGR